MSNNVFEEAPQQGAGATDKVRKAARQLAYDTRYKVKQKFKDGQKADPASLKRAYMQQLGSSSAPGPVKLLAKKMLIGEETYDFTDITDDLKSSSTSVFGKIFVEGGKYVAKEEVEELDEDADTKFTIRVKDKKTGREYYRKADRAKISELRANPNIASVEISGRKESDTYDKTGGKKAKKDYDGDGKIESGTAEYMGSRDKAIKKAMAKEEVIYETDSAFKDEGDKKIDVMKGKNKIKINPNLGENKIKAGITAELKELTAKKVQEAAEAAAKAGPSPEEKKMLMNKDKMLKKKIMMQKQQLAMQKQGRLPLNTEGACVDGEMKKPGEKEDDDRRSMPAKINLAKNKLRAMGLKMSYDMEGEMTEATYPSDFINPDGSKRSVAKKKTGRPVQHDQPMSGGRRKTVDENRLSDEALEAAAKSQQDRRKKQGYKVPGTGAMDDVRARIAARKK